MQDAIRTVRVGWDSTEREAYKACAWSLVKHAVEPLAVFPIKRDEMRAEGLDLRPHNDGASTEFTYTRFLVPRLQEYRGWALFCDCDFLFLKDVTQLFRDYCDPAVAVYCVKHDYVPKQTIKMDNQKQVPYPRKNWSSLILWNCEHPSNRVLSPERIASMSPAELHRFSWVNDTAIGELSRTWNWLIGEYDDELGAKAGYINAVHFTNGGPWHAGYEDVPYAALWHEYYKESLAYAKEVVT